MLQRANQLRRFTLGAQDGEIGRVTDFFFDDESWVVRYLVADTSKWLLGRQVLVSPFAILRTDEDKKVIDVDLTRDQIRNSPPVEEDQPVSRQYEQRYYQYYGWPVYWEGPYMWGPTTNPRSMPATLPPEAGREPDRRPVGDPHLRSVAEVSGYNIHARDGTLGHVDDFILDDEDWAIRYMVVDTRNWWAGKKVLVAPQWIDAVRWRDSEVVVDLDRDTIRTAPEFDASQPITRDYETRLFDHYRRQGYWTTGRRAAA